MSDSPSDRICGARRSVLVTRPLDEARGFAGDIEAEGLESLIWPLTRIVPVGSGITLPPGTDALLVTSSHGIQAFAALIPRRDLPVLAVGARTAQTALQLGFARTISADGDVHALARLAKASAYRRFFYPRGRQVAADLKAMAGGEGRVVHSSVVYSADPAGPPPAPVGHALAAGRVGLVTVWSRRHAEILAGYLDAGLSADLARTALVPISTNAAEPLAGSGFAEIIVPVRPYAAAMLGAILRSRAWLEG